MFCPQCQAENRPTSKFCMRCGASLPATEGGVRPEKEKTGGARGMRTVLWAAIPVVVVATLAFGALSLLRGGRLPFFGLEEKMLVAVLGKDGQVDLQLLRPGQPLTEGVLLAEDALQTDELNYEHWNAYEYLGGSAGYFGAFVPDTDQLLFWYHEEGDEDLIIRALGGKAAEAVELLTTDALPVYLYSFEGRDALQLVESRNNTQRCYRAQYDQVARRLAKGDHCGPEAGGSLMIASEEDDDELTAWLVDMADEEEELLLDGVEGVLNGWVLPSDDGSHVAYLQFGNEGIELFVMDRESDSAVAIGEGYEDIYFYGFIPGRDTLYYVVGTDEDELALYLSNFDLAIATAHSLMVASEQSGDYLLYMLGDSDGENAAYLYNMVSGEVEMLLKADGLQAQLSSALGAVLLWQQDGDEFTLYSAPLEGGELTTIVEIDDVDTARTQYVSGSEQLFVLVTTRDRRQSLYASPLHSSDGFYIIEEWQEIGLLNISPDYDEIVFAGVEDPGDDPLLLLASLAEDGRLVELDDVSDEFANAVFSADGRDLLYTAYDARDADSYEIVRVATDGASAGELLYEGAYLDSVSWASVNPPFKGAASHVWFTSN